MTTPYRQIFVDENSVKMAIVQSLEKFNTFSNNLRDRREIIKFDCLVRGYLGEYVVERIFRKTGIPTENYLKNVYDEQSRMDIDFVLSTDLERYNIEVKTSLIPPNVSFDKDNKNMIDDVHNKCDIKIIKRSHEISVADIPNDVFIQIYYSIPKTTREKKLLLNSDKFNQALANSNVDEIYKFINGQDYIDNTFFVGWNSKENLAIQLEAIEPNQRTWTFSNAQKSFWKCPLASSLNFSDFLNFCTEQSNIIKYQEDIEESPEEDNIPSYHSPNKFKM